MVSTGGRGTTAFCSVLAREKGLDPIGMAHPFAYFLAVEAPLPWQYDALNTADIPSAIPALIKTLRVDYPTRWAKVQPLLIAPDPAYSVPGHRRVLYFRHPSASVDDPFLPVPPDAPAFSTFLRREYLVPEDEAGALCEALFHLPDALPRFEQYRQEGGSVRDFLVCTHGAIDTACARFGAPLWRRLHKYADASDGAIRAWRCTHFGAHVCAPTLLELPTARYWGFIEEEETGLLAERAGDLASLRGCYRGWSGLQSIWLQVAEREALLREGWAWLDYAQAGEVLREGEPAAEGETPRWGEVRLTFTDPATGRGGAYEARIERLEQTIETIYQTGNEATIHYPQYRVSRCERVA